MDPKKQPQALEPVFMSLEQVECLASPQRAEVYWCFEAVTPKSIAEIAAETRSSASATTYHVNYLCKVNLLKPAGERKKRSRTEILYVLTSPTGFQSLGPSAPEEYRQRTLEGLAAILRMMLREREELTKVFGIAPEMADFSTFRRFIYRISPERAVAFKQTIIQQFRELNSEPPDPDGVKIAYSFIMNPVLSESKKILAEHKKKEPDPDP
jgi:hypothetical protein